VSAPVAEVSITIVPPASASALAILRDYFTDIASRYQGRPITEPELDQVLAEQPSDDLAPPSGCSWSPSATPARSAVPGRACRRPGSAR
jgi:hypothetical protein